MQNNLATLSFVCAALLALFIPIARVRSNVTNLAIVAWLVGANLVHGINAIIWAGNVELRVPVWCDIVTKLLVGATVALPGAMLSIARHLELISSNRPISNEPKSRGARVMVEFMLCYVFPIMYMGLHFIVQDHRFDLTEDYGCSASIHPSAVGLILMWLPPLLLCAASFFLCGASISHLFRMPAAAFSVHLEGRAPMGSSIFIRRIAITIITTAVLFVVSLFSVFTISGFLPWTSWAAVHANFTTINVAHSVNETRSIKLVWAGVPIVSIFYIALTLALGEETRDAYRWIGGRIRKIPQWRPRPLVLLPLYSTQSLTELESRSQLATPPPKSLKSGWDDMLESEKKKPKLWSPSRKSPASLRTKSSVTGSLRTISRLPSRASTPSPSLRGTSTVCGEDDAFVKSTLDYLGSPVAKTLGISPPPLMIPLSPATSTIISPAPAYFSPSKPTHHALAKSPTSVRSSHDMPPSPRHVPSDVESVISSVFDASWPQPPPSPPRASSAASRYHTATSQPILTASSPDIGPRVASGTVPTHRHVRPFEGSSISSLVDFPALSQLRPKRTPSVKSVKSLIRTFSAEKVHDGRGPVIYMHVVNEVA